MMESNHSQAYNSEKVDLLERLARPFGVAVRSSDIDYWDSVITVANAIDDLVDNDKVQDISPFMDEVRMGREVQYLNLSDARKFSDIYFDLTPERQARIEQGRMLAEYAIKQRQSESVDEYISLKMGESTIFSGILKIDNSHDDFSARNEFNLWLPSFGKAFYAVDTLKDMKEDYENKNTIINPTPYVMLKLGITAINRTTECFVPAPFGTKIALTSMFNG